MWLDSILTELTTEEPATFKQEKYWTWGCEQQRARTAWIADYCARWPGDLCEIGCYTGGNTKILAQTARKYGRRVIAVDPWEPGTQDCQGGEYEIFMRNMKPFLDVLDIVRLPSQDQRAIDILASAKLCFAIVDGLHTYEGCLSDIRAVSHARVIMIDDALCYHVVRQAVVIGAGETNKRVIQHHLCREAYLVPQ
jgi:hypothetical protein